LPAVRGAGVLDGLLRYLRVLRVGRGRMRPTEARRPVVICWDITHLYTAAQKRADRMPEYKRSMRGAPGNEVGALGELVAIDYLQSVGVDVEDAQQIGYDLSTAHGTFDVKAKERKVPPRPYYECTVPDYVREAQKPDWYLFVSLTSGLGTGVRRFTEAWVLGTISGVDFDRLAVLWEPGKTDSNGWGATVPCWNVKVSSLRPPRTVVQS
jgi:hypothetical protein